MNYQTNTQLKQVLRDGKPDLSFVIAIKRQQATRTIKRLLKASGQLSWFVMARVQSDIEGKSWPLDEYYDHFQLENPSNVVVASEISRQRNHLGQYVEQLG